MVEYRRVHLRKQEMERAEYDRISLKCKSEYDKANGNPKYFQIFPDGMTTRTGDTPVFLINGRTSKQDLNKPVFESRVIGLRIICGPVDELFVYYTDNFARGGSNTMCEVCRRAMKDLGLILKNKHNYRLPKDGFFQFDNCGENKVNIHCQFEFELIDQSVSS